VAGFFVVVARCGVVVGRCGSLWVVVGSLWVVVDRCRSLCVVPCFSNYDAIIWPNISKIFHIYHG
jgi:hypothetical protein